MSFRPHLLGRVLSGRGEACSFTALDWVRQQFLTELGIDPYPGTLNLVAEEPDQRDLLLATDGSCAVQVVPPSSDWCAATCHPVRIGGEIPGAMVLPAVPGYPSSQVELIAAVSLRDALGVADGDAVRVELCPRLPVRAAIFDVDGTLVDSLDALRVTAERAAAPHGLLVTEVHVRDSLNTGRAFWDLVVPDDVADRSELIRSLHRAAAQLWPEALRERGRLLGGVEAMLATLAAAGLRLGIVTGGRGGSFALLDAGGHMQRFDAVITRDDVSQGKPHPEGLLKCAAALGVEPREAVYVGDTPDDVRAARAAGMYAIGILTGAGDSRLLSSCGADRLVFSPERLPRALAIAS